MQEEYDANVANAFTVGTNSDGDATYTPKNGCGRRSKLLKGKNKIKVRILLFSPFSSFTGLIPNNIPIGLKLYLTTSKELYQMCNNIPESITQ